MVKRGDCLAGNKNSGYLIAFRLSEKELMGKMDSFKAEYGEGQHGMVTWELFCSYLGYSVADVRECYQRGISKKCAYTSRAELLEKFYTDVRAMMFQTSSRQQALAKHLATINLLQPEEDAKGGGKRELFIVFGGTDPRAKEAMV